jgi:hypothetical protein
MQQGILVCECAEVEVNTTTRATALLATWNFLGLRNGKAEPAVFPGIRNLMTAARRATMADDVEAVWS